MLALGAATPPAWGQPDGPCGSAVGPTLSDLRRAARRHAGVDTVPRWRRRARLAALLPWMTVRGARALDWDDREYAPVPAEVGNNLVFEARLTWRLDRLLYEPAEPRLDGVARDVARARGALDADVTVLYFRWRRAELAARADSTTSADGTTDGTSEAGKRLDADEAWALLDARTGGWLAREGCRF